MSDGNLAELIAERVPDPSDDDDFGIPDYPLVRGHSAHVGKFVKFPHRCPGPDCAIARWIRQREIES